MVRIVISFIPLFFILSCGSSSDSGSSVSQIGTGGSTAKFTIVDDNLYILDSENLKLFDVSEAEYPTPLTQVYVPFDVQTLFAYKEYLFLGAESGVYIYKNSLEYISKFTHMRSCDPVVVSEDIAFVTLHTNNRCWFENGANRLEVLDVSNPEYPTLLNSYPMWEPKGLGVDGNMLFICDGNAGLKIFEIDDGSVSQIESLFEIDCKDVIPIENNLIATAEDGIYQIDYSTEDFEILSKIGVGE
jgi:hypothetical protein